MQTNTFQMVLATDEVYTYAIWNYAVLNWLSHTEAGGDTTKGEGGTPAYVSHIFKLLIFSSRRHLIKHFTQKKIHLHISNWVLSTQVRNDAIFMNGWKSFHCFSQFQFPI